MDGSGKFLGPFQTKSLYKWIQVQNLGTMRGGLNGGIIKVHRADDPSGRIYIEKRYTREHVNMGLAKREIALLWQLSNHEYIVKLLDYYLDDKRQKSSIYLEYCDQGSLSDFIDSRNGVNYVTEDQVWQWFLNTMKALYFCQYGSYPHNPSARKKWERVWHRDLKPANILLTRHHKHPERIIAKIADFGLSTSKSWNYDAFKQGKDVWRASGWTPGFDPPEFPDRFTGRSDLWQLALCMVCLCTLIQNPRSRYNPNGHPWNKERPAGHRYSRELNQMLKYCLAEDMEYRPEVEEALTLLKQGYERFKSDPGQSNPIHWPDLPTRTPLDPANPRIGGRDDRYAGYLQGHRLPDPMYGFYPFGRPEEDEYDNDERFHHHHKPWHE